MQALRRCLHQLFLDDMQFTKQRFRGEGYTKHRMVQEALPGQTFMSHFSVRGLCRNGNSLIHKSTVFGSKHWFCLSPLAPAFITELNKQQGYSPPADQPCLFTGLPTSRQQSLVGWVMMIVCLFIMHKCSVKVWIKCVKHTHSLTSHNKHPLCLWQGSSFVVQLYLHVWPER